MDQILEQALERSGGFDPHDMPAAEAVGASSGITIENRSGQDYVVAVANKVLGFAGSGYIKNGKDLTIPTSWAWWDVYGLVQSSGSGLFLKGSAVTIVRYTWSKKTVGWQDTVEIK